MLILGETGTGKELVASALHTLGARSQKRFIAINCGGLSEELLHSTLFGHVAGAFTGAREAREGLFQAADGGTLFLDEIGEMPTSLQKLLLRTLETKKIRRLALKSALSDRAAAGRIAVIEELSLPEIKTKPVVALLEKMELAQEKVLILSDRLDENLALSTRNIPNVLAMPAREANTYTVVAADWILVTKKGLAQLEEVFS